MASDIQRGTRGLSAGDWVRLKRLNGAVGRMIYVIGTTSPPTPILNKDITNPAPISESHSGRRVYTEFGTSKIRRPASNYTDYIASQKADYVLETPNGSCGVTKDLTINRICTCQKTSAKKVGLCAECGS
jgi:hypothetical protein